MPTRPTLTLPRRHVRDVDLAAHYDVSRNTIWRWARSGRLPAPVRLGPGCTRWRLDVIEAHDARLAERQPDDVA